MVWLSVEKLALGASKKGGAVSFFGTIMTGFFIEKAGGKTLNGAHWLF